MIVVGLAFLVLSSQDSLETYLERLKDDKVDVRERAAGHLVELFPAHGPAIRERAEAATDLEVRARLREIVRAGAVFADRREFIRALSPRVRASYPELDGDLFSRDLRRRELALKALARSGSAMGSADDPHRAFFMTDAECRKAVPSLAGLLRSDEDHEPVRLAWIELVAQRPFLLSDPRVAIPTRKLFQDPSRKVRAEALEKLHRTPAFDDEVPRLLRDLESLDVGTWSCLERGIAGRKIEAGYPYLVKRLREPKHANRIAALIFLHDVRALVPEIVKAFESGTKFSSSILEKLPPDVLKSVLVAKLDGTQKDRQVGIYYLKELRIEDQADRVARELAHPKWSVRTAALNYLTIYGAPRHASAVARCLREFWNGVGVDSKISRSVASTCAGLLARWNAHQEIRALTPRINSRRRFSQAQSMISQTKPAGAARQICGLVDPSDLYFSGQVLAVLGDLDAREEFIGHQDTVLRILQLNDENGWSSYGYRLSLHAGMFGMRDLIPLFVGWKEREKRRNAAAWALRHLWTPKEKIDALGSADPDLRFLGLWSVSKEDPDEVRERLRAMSGHEDPEARKAATFALGRDTDPDAAAQLLRLTYDKDKGVALVAAWCFLQLKCPDNDGYTTLSSSGTLGPAHSYEFRFEDGVELLGHPNAYIRLAAARSLTPKVVVRIPELLFPLLKDSDRDVQDVAWDLYEKHLGFKDPPRMARRFFSDRTDACRLTWGLRNLSTQVEPEVMAPLTHRFLEEVLDETKVFKIRSFRYPHGGMVYDKTILVEDACRLLGAYGYRKAEPTLLKLLDSTDPKMRLAALEGIGGLRSEEAVPQLIELLPTKLGPQAAKALGQIGVFPPDFLDSKKGALGLRLQAVKIARHRKAFEEVAAFTRSPHWPISTGAVQTLGALARPQDAARILRLVYTPVSRNRAGLLKILRRFRAPELVAEVASFLDDKPEVALEAARFLVAQGARIPPGELPVDLRAVPPGVLEILLPVIGTKGAKDHLHRLLEEIGRPADGQNWSRALSASRALSRHADPRVLPDHVAAVRRFSSHWRTTVIPELARGYGRACVGFLREELRSGTDSSRPAAARALAELGDRERRAEIEGVLMEAPHSYEKGKDIRALLQLDLTASARRLLEDHKDERTLAAAARRGLPEAWKAVLEGLKKPAPLCVKLIDELNRAWNPELREGVLQWSPPTGSARFDGGGELLDRTGRLRMELAPGVEEELSKRLLPYPLTDDISPGAFAQKLIGAPYPRWSYFVTPEGVLHVDAVEKIRQRWIERLTR